MYLDAFGLVSDAQALSATAFSTNTIDLSNVTPKREVGTGEPVGFAVTVDVAADVSSGNETYLFEIVQSANADLSSPDVLIDMAIDKAVLVAGYAFFVPLPPGWPQKRYLGMRFTLGGTTPTITVTSWFTLQKMFSVLAKSYAKNYVV